jgi:hypothetical protein
MTPVIDPPAPIDVTWSCANGNAAPDAVAVVVSVVVTGVVGWTV